MDATPIIVGIALINGAVFLTGCTIAVVRTLRDRTVEGHRPSVREPNGLPTPEKQLRHVGPRAH